jgi:hypothetical protein
MRFLMLGGLVFLTAGCVGKGKYNALYDDYEEVMKENKKLSADLEECEEKRKQKPASPARPDGGGARNR